MSRQRQLNGRHSDSSEFDFDNLPDQASPFEQIEAWTQWAGLAGAGTSHGLPSEVQQFITGFASPMQDAIDLKSGGTSKPGGGGTGTGGTGGTILPEYTSGAVDLNLSDSFEPFNIQIKFNGTWTAKQQSVVIWAADTLSKIITAGLGNDTNPFTLKPVDDVCIDMSVGSIDRAGSILFGNTLAETKVTSVRTAGEIATHPATQDYLPVTSTIKLDSYDLASSTWSSTWDLIILHEMVHAIGFVGDIFKNKGLIDPVTGNFSGTTATSAYGGLVPVESAGGTGTAGSHWSEALFNYGAPPSPAKASNEIMTGIIGPGELAYLSDVTIAALYDIGYTTSDPDTTLKYAMLDSGQTVL